MPADITIRKDKKAEMAYVGETPWHGLGQSLPENASIEEWQKAAGLDWWFLRSPVFCKRNDGNLVEVPQSDVIYRSDNGKPLSIVSSNYKLVQPGEVLNFFSDLVEDYDFKIETAGSLMEGRRIWAMARTGKECEVVKNDRVKSYLLLSTSCDGSLSTRAMFTSVRVVCNNTLQLSFLKDGKNAVKVRHTSVFNPYTIKKDLGIFVNELSGSFDLFMDDMKKMAEKKITSDQAETIVSQLFTESKSSRPVWLLPGYMKIMELFNGKGKGADMEGVHETAWGLINAVTEYADYYAAARSQDYRLSNAWFGKTANMKEHVVKLLMDA